MSQSSIFGSFLRQIFIMITKLSQNLLWLRNNLENDKISQEEMSKRLGITKPTYARYERGENEPKLEDILKMSEVFGLTTDQLLKEDVSIKKTNFRNEKLRILATTVNSQNEDNIEYVPIKAVAGYIEGYGDIDFIERLPVFNVPFLHKDKKYRLFPIVGDSMLPLKEGSLVFAEYVEDWKNIKNGTVCIIVTRDEGIVLKKVFNYLNEKNLLVLKSTNERFAPYAVLGEDINELWKFVGYFNYQFPT
jgi:transcriptional regulator with XRE-family HTH domain